MNVALLPARAGSKRIPDKNIRDFYGRPMIWWPIHAAKEAKIFDAIIVSTESENIAAIARDCGAEIPFKRPEILADDHTTTAMVLLQALDEMKRTGIHAHTLCCIYPTSPFLYPDDLKRGLEELQKYNAPSVISATTYDYPIARAFRENNNGSISFNFPKYALTRTQDTPKFIHDAGKFYWLDTAKFIASKNIVMYGSRPLLLPRKRALDIDTPEDWELAELMAPIFLKDAYL